MKNDKRTGYEEAANALTQRAAGHFKNGDYELQDECLQCASMLHDMKPLAERASNPASPDVTVNQQLLESLKDARHMLYGNGAGNPKIDAAIAAAEARAASPAPVAASDEQHAEFAEYFTTNYRAGTVISNPAWHAPRLLRAAARALSTAPQAQAAQQQAIIREAIEATFEQREGYMEKVGAAVRAIAAAPLAPSEQQPADEASVLRIGKAASLGRSIMGYYLFDERAMCTFAEKLRATPAAPDTGA